jgi:hypothetical protein
VKSNPEGSIGFLATENRVCVALSRAKQGLFITGNMDMLAANNKTWQEIRKSLQDQDAIGNTMPLRWVFLDSYYQNWFHPPIATCKSCNFYVLTTPIFDFLDLNDLNYPGSNQTYENTMICVYMKCMHSFLSIFFAGVRITPIKLSM